MRKKLLLVLGNLPWVLLMFLFTPALEAPLIAQPIEPPKPLKVWTAVASWYGPRFDGRRTANGEIFDMDGPTAAHLHLPFGSVVRLVYPKTGKSQVVRINDRGPYVEGRDFDVSYGVARHLGMEHRGVARLRIELLQVPERR